MTTSEDTAARRRLADAQAALAKRQPKPVRREMPLTDKQRRECVEFHRRVMVRLDATMPDWMADAAARGYVFVSPDDEETIRVVREAFAADESRIDGLADRMKRAGVGVYAKRRRTGGARRMPGIAGRETAALAH